MYLDANFFILMNFGTDTKGIKARTILKNITRGKRAITSSLALDEVMWALIKNKKRDEVRGVIEDIYTIKNLEVKEVSPLIPLRALDFMDKHNLRPRDAFHTALMEQFGSSQIVSDDKDFDRIPGIRRIKL